MNIGEAVEALQKGYRVYRKGWNSQNQWLSLTPGSHIPHSAICWPMTGKLCRSPVNTCSVCNGPCSHSRMFVPDSGCTHPRVVFRKHADRCWWACCAICGQRGPRKHSRPLARARMRSVGTQFRGRAQRVRYTSTAARDDRRFQIKRGKR